ncbi:MAG: cytochrome c3 family protein [Desulfobacterales bacterium]|jgi:hypothetical protein
MNRYLFYVTGLFTVVISLIAANQTWATPSEADAAYSDEDCIECHRTDSQESDLHIDMDAYGASVHSQEITCQECHTGVVDEGHQSIDGSGAVDCSDCHEQENRHGPEDERLQCHACHPAHAMRSKTDPDSAVHPNQLPVTCGGCHPETSGDTGYFTWFPAFQIASHNKGDFGNAYEKTNCLGCHQGAGAHGEAEPITDDTCYKCHLSAESKGALWGKMHPVADRQTQPAVFAAASIYQVFIGVGLLVLLGWFFRSRPRSGSRAIGTDDVSGNKKR